MCEEQAAWSYETPAGVACVIFGRSLLQSTMYYDVITQPSKCIDRKKLTL